MTPAAIYYLHPLLAGPLPDWDIHFERSALMGFTKIRLAPPFRTGRGGDIFLTADHDRVHAQLGGGHTISALEGIVARAGAYGLEIHLDVVVDRVARERATGGRWISYANADAGLKLPDPRKYPSDRYAADLSVEAEMEVSQLWIEYLRRWSLTGVKGFCFDGVETASAAFWARLIAGVREGKSDVTFMASSTSHPANMLERYGSCGFDHVASSSWAWDFRSEWLEAETKVLAKIGGLVTSPTLAFNGPDSSAGVLRALEFAATYGNALLVPMGFEYGATKLMHRSGGDPVAFRRMSEAPASDLSNEVKAAIRTLGRLGGFPAGRIVSPPFAPIAELERGPERVMVNASLVKPWRLLDGGAPLRPAEVRVVRSQPAKPIYFQVSNIAVNDAIAAPRLAIEAVEPSVENGRFPAKQRVGSMVAVTADIVCDGHDKLAAAVLWRAADETEWQETRMRPLANDVWTAEFLLARVGRYIFTVEAWHDEFATYRDELEKKQAAGLKLDIEITEGSELIHRIAEKTGSHAIQALAAKLFQDPAEALSVLIDPATAHLMSAHDPRRFRLRHPAEFSVDAERAQAGFASWYEIFPRSQASVAGQHGTFRDVIAKLSDIRKMGFDILYFPPIHPIGRTNRKGPNNALQAEESDPGSPYAIGTESGGHDAVHPELGTLDEFRELVSAASEQGLEIALDFAIQCSPDHPWLREHPEWFTWRPDGSIRYAENPPKRYEDIVNVEFYANRAMPSLWSALRDVVQFWVNQGIRIFRVDNPHTKPLPFWEWLIADIRGRDPNVMFLAEAFTKPKMMYRLAKVGFSQSYTYFTWRNTALEMREYLTELNTSALSKFFRPHFFVNTPDINPGFLHHSGRPGFLLRAALAATLAGLWGVYNGFEVCEGRSLRDREEYLDSEKYQLRQWDLTSPGNIVGEITRLNEIRRSNPALQSHLGLRFIDCANDNLLCYIKTSSGGDNVVLVLVNFDPFNAQEGDLYLEPAALGLSAHGSFVVDDLMGRQEQSWNTGHRRLLLDPSYLPFAIWRIRPNAEET